MVELMVAVSVIALGFLGLWTAFGQCLSLARAHQETIAATECLQQRVEQARSVGWNALLSANGISGQIFNTPCADAGMLPNLTETITVAPYPALTPAPTPLLVKRTADGTVTVVTQPAPAFDLRSILSVRVDFSMTWTDHQNNRQHTRQNSTVIALEGLLR